MSCNPFRGKKFPLILALLGGIAARPAPASGQTDDGFQRRYLDAEAEAQRTGGVLISAWPELSRLVWWSERVEREVGEMTETFSEDLLLEFRLRVDSLAASDPPAVFDATETDTLRAAIGRLVSALDEAEASLALTSPEATLTGEETRNAPEDDRTLVTGNTAVRVPAGIAVGANDSLPRAEVGPDEPNFVERLTVALEALDEVVHLARGAVDDAEPATEDRSEEETSSSPRTGPRPPEP